MDSYKEDIILEKASIDQNSSSDVPMKIDCLLSLEPFEHYLSEFREDLHKELDSISKIVWTE